MKKSIITAIAAAALLFTPSFISAQDKNSKKEAEVTFSADIDCPSCKKKLESKLPYEPGVKDLKIDIEKKTIWLKYDPSKTDKNKLAKALEKLGYASKEVTSVQNPSEAKSDAKKGEEKGQGKEHQHGKTHEK
ncbi:MAG: heavy-metal-associated domain-containing protein [Bacteroidales bacterium]|nr:heavy-metal-associated domain-containing protein [Bacteroidales bacterium]MDD2425041.1 heavy-metal-associated domain-containing protein [Bacteroidales bacterium]MDD3988650.1 heavy-metal-associated domain-containing protein [Bacteroidales bacterium]MDD4638332.1 heavy-metal-associated domain-containing protein [Bacteroidales bacterium]